MYKSKGNLHPPENYSRRGARGRRRLSVKYRIFHLLARGKSDQEVSPWRARNIFRQRAGATLQLSRVTRTCREKRGTVVVAIITAIVTIGSHYRGIMCDAARNSRSCCCCCCCFLNASGVARTRGTGNRQSDSFDRLSPTLHPLPSLLHPMKSFDFSSSCSFFSGLAGRGAAQAAGVGKK